MLKYIDSKKFGIIEFKSQQEITANYQRKTKEQYKALKQRIETIQDSHKNK